MHHTKKTIAILMCMIIIIIGIIMLVLLLLNHLKQENEFEGMVGEEIVSKDSEKVTNKTTFYRTNDCINEYINDIKLSNEEAYKQINDKTVGVTTYEDANLFHSEEMYSIDKKSNITVFVKGKLRFSNKEEEKYYIVNLDYNNDTFKIEDSNYEEYENATNNQIKREYENEISIEKGEHNKIPNNIINDLAILKGYFDDYKFKAIYKPEEAFSILDENYKKQKFDDDIEEFKMYIQNNIDVWQDANIVKHRVSKEDGYTKYIFVDNYNHYYELKETGIEEYTIILDNYTILSEQQQQTYKGQTEEEKALSNMNKVMKLINEKDYQTIYDYLNQSFKNTNFPTLEVFVQYMQEHFFENNIVGKIGIRKEGDIFILSVPYKESLSKAAEDLEQIFLMKLMEGMDFELSFEV